MQEFLQNYEQDSLPNMGISDAIWHIEGALNYKNRYIRFAYEEISETELDFTYDWSDGQEFTGTQLKAMMDETQQVIATIPSDRKFIATDFRLTNLTDNSITMAVSIAEALPSGMPPFNVDGYHAEANYNLECQASGVNTAAYRQVASKAFKKYINGLTFYPTQYTWYTSTRLFSSISGQGSLISSDKLFGHWNALYSSHRSQHNVSAGMCILASEIEGYRDYVLSQVTNLGNTIYALEIEAINSQESWGLRGVWRYKKVRVSAENYTTHSPAL